MEYKIEFSGRALNYSDDEIRIINDVAKNADPLTQGPYLQNFEQNIKKYLGVDYAFGLTNGASALELAAVLCRLKKGDEVIIPSHTYCATAIPFGRTGAKIVWADIDPETFVISESDIKNKVTNNTKVIVLVHLYGQACDMGPILKICSDNNIKLVEDCAQSIGAKYKNKHVGSFGDFACFSLHAQKNITTLGEGGLLIVKDKLDASKVKGLRHNGHTSYGEREEYWKPAMTNVDLDIDGVWPFNYSMTEIQAALGSKLLERLDNLNRQRITRANIFIDEMSEYSELTFQNPEDEYENVRHLLPAKYYGSQYGKCSHDLISLLSKKYKIKTIVQYYPLNRYPLFKKMGFGHAKCPNSDNFFDNMISFPFHHWMSDKDFLYLIDSVKLSLNELRES
jgi:dTDP-4-amino-4,6-dideoxygalactose transaminase